jgi:hypothetical protein
MVTGSGLISQELECDLVTADEVLWEKVADETTDADFDRFSDRGGAIPWPAELRPQVLRPTR